MLRITESESSAAAKNYFGSSLKRGDYYLEGQEIAGYWGGKGALLLGLNGPVSQEEFCNLLENIRPNGERLTARTVANRRPGYDFTFDVPKSVSLMHAVGGDKRIEDAMKMALDGTMEDIEKEMHTRVRKAGVYEDRRTENMVWADFKHFTSRPSPIARNAVNWSDVGVSVSKLKNEKGEVLLPDPHLHVHVYVMNATFDPVENEWKAGVFMPAKRDAPYFQAVYHTRLAGELQKLGYAIEPTAKAFEIVGVDRDLIEKFSRRTKEVEKAAAELGINNADAKAELGARTRRAKSHALTHTELARCWAAFAGPDETARLKRIVALSKQTAGVILDSIEKGIGGVSYALSKELERVSETSERRVLAAALERSIGNATVETVHGALKGYRGIMRAVVEGEKRLTTIEVLKEEARLLQLVRDAKDSVASLVSGDYRFSNRLFAEDSAKEQRAAVEQIMRSQDWVFGLVGRAGTGKTTLLKEIGAGLRKAGMQLVAVAPTAEASRGVLRAEGFASADTVKRLLVDSKFQRSLRGNVLWIDEAGMLGNRDMIDLLALAKANGARKVVLAGDPTQIRSVPRGDALRFLEENAGLAVARLEKIQRQKRPLLREAVEAISKAEMARGLELLAENGGIVVDTTKGMYSSIAQAFAERAKTGHSVLVVCPTHKEGGLVSQKIRQALRDAGELSKHEREVVQTINFRWTGSEKKRAASYDRGMVIQFRQNMKGFTRSERVRVVEVNARKGAVEVLRNNGERSKLPLGAADKFDVYRLGKLPVSVGDKLRVTQNTIIEKYRLNNGDMVKVTGFTRDGGIEVGEGRVLPSHFGHLAHGYVHTADAAQAKTVDSVLVCIGRESMGATDMRRVYVAVSRARHEAKIFTDDKERLELAARRDSVRRSGMELVGMRRAKRVLDWVLRHNRMKTPRPIKTPAPSIQPRTPTPPEIEMEM